MSEGLLLVISGPSGAGKGTVVRELCRDERFALSTSVATRPPRPGEKDGVDYFFISREEFFRMRDSGELLESTDFVRNCYGTPLFFVEQQIGSGKILVLEIDVIGALQVRDKFKDAVLVFLIPPDKNELKKRITERATENASIIDDRMRRADEEIELIHKYDYLVVNDKVDNVIRDIDAIINAELLKPARKRHEIDKFKGGI